MPLRYGVVCILFHSILTMITPFNSAIFDKIHFATIMAVIHHDEKQVVREDITEIQNPLPDTGSQF